MEFRGSTWHFQDLLPLLLCYLHNDYIAENIDNLTTSNTVHPQSDTKDKKYGHLQLLHLLKVCPKALPVLYVLQRAVPHAPSVTRLFHPALQGLGFGVDLSYPVHIPVNDIISPLPPKCRKVLPRRRAPISSRSLIRDRIIDICEVFPPLVQGKTFEDGGLGRDFSEGGDEMIPSNHFACNFKILG